MQKLEKFHKHTLSVISTIGGVSSGRERSNSEQILRNSNYVCGVWNIFHTFWQGFTHHVDFQSYVLSKTGV